MRLPADAQKLKFGLQTFLELEMGSGANKLAILKTIVMPKNFVYIWTQFHKYLGPQPEQQKAFLLAGQKLWDGIRNQGNKVFQHPKVARSLLPGDLPHHRREESEGRDEELQGRQRRHWE